MISYWERETFLNHYDVAIIGAGLVGVCTAIYLKKANPKLSIIVLERGTLPNGASTKNAGFACFGSVSEILADLKNNPPEEVFALIEKRWAGLQNLIALLGQSTLDLQWNGGYELFTDSQTIAFENAMASLSFINGKVDEVLKQGNVFSLSTDKITAFGFGKVKQLIYNKAEGQLHTGKMMYALLQLAQQLGVFFLYGTPVTKIEKGIFYIKDSKLRATNIAITTNGFINELLPGIDVQPARAQVLITQPIANLPILGTFHHDEGYYYFRNINNRILLGGARNSDFETEQTTELITTASIQQKLDTFLREIILPNTPYEIDMRWSGIMAMGKGRSPIIKQINENIFVAVRCNGMGVALGSQTAKDLAMLILS
jgi:gamma-glutamylputrescine oxidase